MNSHNRQRLQNMGKSVLSKLPKLVAEILSLNKKGFTGTAWCRSRATALADGCAGVTNLKYAGGWKSNTVAEGYVAKRPAMKKEKTGTGVKPAAAVAKSPDDIKSVPSSSNVSVSVPDDIENVPSDSNVGVSVAGRMPDWSITGSVVINNYFTT
eukprot:11405356-Ditylum_brightwellii.AAC.1